MVAKIAPSAWKKAILERWSLMAICFSVMVVSVAEMPRMLSTTRTRIAVMMTTPPFSLARTLS
ncbi:MAG: hypothetical protein CSA23_05820 [Deltaproteobacteria bacterium]|nr:MAG: hypothetical protein CSA23_05820 [Deltaproteobacteria bacterium]